MKALGVRFNYISEDHFRLCSYFTVIVVLLSRVIGLSGSILVPLRWMEVRRATELHSKVCFYLTKLN